MKADCNRCVLLSTEVSMKKCTRGVRERFVAGPGAYDGRGQAKGHRTGGVRMVEVWVFREI